jgi:hypothetical protein
MGSTRSTDELQVQHSSSQPQGSSRDVREMLGEWMVDAVDWADSNRRSLVWGSLLGVCSECWATPCSVAVVPLVYQQSWHVAHP